jgi:hypothetical protein
VGRCGTWQNLFIRKIGLFILKKVMPSNIHNIAGGNPTHVTTVSPVVTSDPQEIKKEGGIDSGKVCSLTAKAVGT